MGLLFLQRGFGWRVRGVATMICANDAFKGLKKHFRRAVITSSLAYPSWDGEISAGNGPADSYKVSPEKKRKNRTKPGRL